MQMKSWINGFRFVRVKFVLLSLNNDRKLS